ncbi:MAG: hypothetical protein FWG62_00710, partial [Proteobacteria bacterium]|nr:hypothetical protein [Pseudomonadota bacterium]
MPGDAEFSPEHLAHPAARIRARLKERRVLEARFLLRQFEDELDAGERQALEQEVSRRLAEVERLRHQAKAAAAEGRREEAGRLYRALEQLAADVPGLPEERAALAGAEALFSRPPAHDAGTAGSAPAGSPALDQDRVKREVLAGKAAASQEWQQAIASHALKKAAVRPPRRRGRFLGLWLAVVGCAGLAVLALL